MNLELENVVITGRTFDEYSAFFDLKVEYVKVVQALLYLWQIKKAQLLLVWI